MGGLGCGCVVFRVVYELWMGGWVVAVVFVWGRCGGRAECMGVKVGLELGLVTVAIEPISSVESEYRISFS